MANKCLLYSPVQDDFSELRFDVPLPPEADAGGFERGWRDLLAAQKLTALTLPPASAVSARFRLCGMDFEGQRKLAWNHYLTVRLGALPGAPAVTTDTIGASPDWRGVKIWLSYPSRDLATLLKKSKQKSHSSHYRGRRS